MAKRKKFKEISAPTVISIVGFTAEEHEQHYKRDYEFNKCAPVRSPVDGWAYKYANEDQSSLPPKEIAMIKGTPHKFKNIRTGNVYSGRKAIKRIK